MQRDDLVHYLDGYLQVAAIEDRSNNGLQVEGVQEVERIAFAVDGSMAAFEAAASAGAQMLIVHHGLFWGEPILVTGIHRRRLAGLFDAGISLYAAHLPLDFHSEVGNNVTLARWLVLEEVTPFGDYHGYLAGVVGSLAEAMPLDRFATLVEETLQEPVVKVWPFGVPVVRRVGISSGGASFLLQQAGAEGVDVFLTGEMSHSAFHEAKELGLNVIYGGHYATETAGLKALAAHLSARFAVETTFLDLPTGA
jgi:dinuclear metal center YbgI/SA1388 family protein